MKIKLYHQPYCFEFLPSISLQQCLGEFFWYIAWLTFAIEIGPDENNHPTK